MRQITVFKTKYICQKKDKQQHIAVGKVIMSLEQLSRTYNH